MVIQLRDGTVEFLFYRPDAKHVSLAGDCSDWQNLPMNRGPDGWWRCQICAAPGCYHFRYLCDGLWFMDYAAFGLDYGPHGLNSVVSVAPPSPTVASLQLLRNRIAQTNQTSRRRTVSPTTHAAPIPYWGAVTVPTGT
jgi:1,4-alpha-glucan branching enzyme